MTPAHDGRVLMNEIVREMPFASKRTFFEICPAKVDDFRNKSFA